MERQTVPGGDRRSMSDSDVRERAGRSHRAGGPVFDLVAAKLLPSAGAARDRPSVAADRTAGARRCPVRSSRWSRRRVTGRRRCCRSGPSATARPSRGCRSTKRDNDPKVLLTYVAEALDAVEPIDRRVFDALASPGSSVPGSVVPRLGSAFWSMTSPVVLVLDDVHALHNSECRAALSVLADHVPAGSRLVLAGRAEPPLRVARLRAEGRILEIGPGDLSLTCEEAAVAAARC